MEKPSIFKYHDYLLYFQDWLNYKKTSEQPFSIRQWCKIISASPSLISMFLKRERDLSDTIFYRMIQQMELKKNEREAFSLLRIISTSNSSADRSLAFSKLIKIPEYKKENINNLNVFQYLSSWLNVTLRELAFTDEFIDDPLWIKNRIHIHVEKKDIEKSLNFLKENKYLVPNENNKWIPAKGQLDCSEGVYKLSLADFHKKMLSLASHSIDTTPRKLRLINGHTFSISKEQFNDAQKILEEAINKIENLNKIEKTNDVYHLEIALFPLTKINEEDKNEK